MVFIYDLLVGHDTTIEFQQTLILEAFLFIVNGKALFFRIERKIFLWFLTSFEE